MKPYYKQLVVMYVEAIRCLVVKLLCDVYANSRQSDKCCQSACVLLIHCLAMCAGETTERFDGKTERVVLRTRTTAAGVVASALQGEGKLLVPVNTDKLVKYTAPKTATKYHGVNQTNVLLTDV